MIDDSVKQKLLDALAEEPTMVLSTAYAYAKNYVLYGEDITKAWTTAVQQASILEQIKVNAQAEAYDSFKKEYENRLKADLVAILTELQLEIEEKSIIDYEEDLYDGGECVISISEINEIIQEKINALKEKEDEP
jgi:hypothetical protein